MLLPLSSIQMVSIYRMFTDRCRMLITEAVRKWYDDVFPMRCRPITNVMVDVFRSNKRLIPEMNRAIG